MTGEFDHLGLAALAAAAPLPGQSRRSWIWPGTRVRTEAPALGPGRVVRRVYVERGDTLFLVPDHRRGGGGEIVALPRADVRRLEVSHGRKRHAVVGGGVGLVAGTVAGGLHGNAAGARASSGHCGSGGRGRGAPRRQRLPPLGSA